MKRKLGVQLGVTFAVLVSFLFAAPTQSYQVEAAKTKTEKKATIKRTANKKITVKVKKYIDGDTTRFKLKNGKNVTAQYLLIETPEIKKIILTHKRLRIVRKNCLKMRKNPDRVRQRKQTRQAKKRAGLCLGRWQAGSRNTR